MENRIVFELLKLRAMIQASVDALDNLETTTGNLTGYGMGYRQSRIDVLDELDRILQKEEETE